MSFAKRPMVGGVVRTLNGATLSVVGAVPPTQCGIVVYRNGIIEGWEDVVVRFQRRWHRSFNATVGDNYWVRVTRVSGDSVNFVGSTGTWLQLNVTSRTFWYSPPVPSSLSGTYTVEIASDSGGSTIVSSSGVGVFSFSLTP